MTDGAARASNARGFALIAVVWFLVLIAAIGTYLMAHARSETALARNIRAAAAAEVLADAGVAEAVFNRSDAAAANCWRLDGEPHAIAFGGGEIVIRLYDETAKINPNRASDALLAGLFDSLGADRGRARRLGAAIADWVSGEAEPRPFGAKLQQYRAAGKTYGPPNAPVESLDELNLVLGMTPELLALARPYLTIYTEDEEPKSASLSTAVRRALALARRAEALSDEASEEPRDSDAPAPAPVGGQGAQPGAAAKPAPEVLDLEIRARSADGGVFVRHAIVRIDAGKPKGYAVLDWRRGRLPE